MHEMRKPAIVNKQGVYCGDCKVQLTSQVDTQDNNEWCWSCPKCDEWFMIDGYPAFHGTCVAEADAP